MGRSILCRYVFALSTSVGLLAPTAAAQTTTTATTTPPPMTWKLLGLPMEWSVTRTPCIPLRISVTGQRATGILLTTTLIEQSTKESMASRLFLSLDGTITASAERSAHKSAAPASKPANPQELEKAVNEAGQQVFLCAKAQEIGPGKYLGALNISAAQKPEGDPVAVTVFATNGGATTLGIVLLGLGCVLAFVLKVLAPAGLAKSQALLPAALISERARALSRKAQEATAGTGLTAPATSQALLDITTALSETALESENLIPRTIPLPFGGTVDTAKYKTKLDEASGALSRLDLLVSQGLIAAIHRGGTNLATVFNTLDQLATAVSTMTVEQLKTRIDTELQTLIVEEGRTRLEGPPAGPSTVETLTLQIEQSSLLVWTASVVLSFAIGVFVLVLNNPAFGVPMDFLYCFVWGFGLPAVAGQLTATSAGTALGLTVPKVGA